MLFNLGMIVKHFRVHALNTVIGVKRALNYSRAAIVELTTAFLGGCDSHGEQDVLNRQAVLKAGSIRCFDVHKMLSPPVADGLGVVGGGGRNESISNGSSFIEPADIENR